MQDTQRIGERIQKRRKALGLAAADLGSRVGVSHAAVLKWEKGQVKAFDEERLEAIARALDMAPDDLLYGVEQVTEADKLASDMTERSHIAFEITEARAAKRWTQTELARQMGVDVSLISRIENEERKPTNHQIFQLEKLLGVRLRDEPWVVTTGYSLGQRIPATAPEGFMEFITSEACAALELAPVQLALLAGMAGHPDYWQPKNEQEWVDLAEALVTDFTSKIDFRIVPAVKADLLKQLDER